jgi:DNA repair protein RadA/Sms
MAKVKKAYYCKECGNEAPKWFGQCPACGAWGSCSEEVVARVGESSLKRSGESRPQRVAEIADADHQRIALSSPEVNRVLGGGLVRGSMVLLGGEPGIGKSTLSLQIALASEGIKTHHVSGEESASQI